MVVCSLKSPTAIYSSHKSDPFCKERNSQKRDDFYRYSGKICSCLPRNEVTVAICCFLRISPKFADLQHHVSVTAQLGLVVSLSISSFPVGLCRCCCSTYTRFCSQQTMSGGIRPTSLSEYTQMFIVCSSSAPQNIINMVRLCIFPSLIAKSL